VLLYRYLARLQPSPVVDLNHAVAVAMVEGPLRGLALLEELAEDRQMQTYHLYHAARADLLRRAGWLGEAATAYRAALALTDNAVEQAYLQRRLFEVTGKDAPT
jgi:RNA polymerase sigma-70 factor (ECF subfamily)